MFLPRTVDSALSYWSVNDHLGSGSKMSNIAEPPAARQGSSSPADDCDALTAHIPTLLRTNACPQHC